MYNIEINITLNLKQYLKKIALPSPNKAVQILINTIKIVSAHMIKERIREILFKRLSYSNI